MDEGVRGEMLDLCSMAAADIAAFKSQQWQVAYYSLAAQGALAAVMQLVAPKDCYSLVALAVVLGLAAVWVGVQSVLIIRDLDAAIEKSRERSRYARRKLSESFQGAFPKEPSEDWTQRRKRPSRLMQHAIVASVLLCWLLIGRHVF